MGKSYAFAAARRFDRNTISTLAVATALLVATPAFADQGDAALQGHVAGVAAGTQVQVIDTVTGHKSMTTVDDKGNYQILGLRPSSYRVMVGDRTPQDVTLSVSSTTVVDFEQPGAADKQIVVTGTRSRLEVRTQDVATSITPDQIENLPQDSRNFLSFAALAPGIQIANFGSAAQIQAGALSPSNVNVFIDGVSFKNAINHGGVLGQNFGQGGNPFPQIAIQEYKIETQNFGAETGQAGTAVINSITKTGGNTFHGGMFVEFQPNAFIERNYFDKLNNVPKSEYNRKQFGGDFSGPIIKDKLTFYIAAEAVSEKLPGSTGMLNPIAGGYPDNVVKAVVGTPHNYDFHQGLYFGKLTFYATPQDTVNLEGYVRRETNLGDIDSNAAITHGRNIQTQETRYQLSWKHATATTVNNFYVSYDIDTQSTPSIGTGPEYNISNLSNPANVNDPANRNFNNNAELGAHFFTQGDRQTSLTFKDDFVINRGAHKIKLGAQVVALDLTRAVSNADNGRFYYYNTGAGTNFDPASAVPYGADVNIEASPAYNGKDTQIGLYAQDEYKPDDHWTFNYGLRWDLETNPNNNKYVTPAGIVAGLANYPNLAAAGINYHDYISTGNNRKLQYANFQPRLGFAYDVKGDRDLVIFGGAGRYYDRSLFIESVIESQTNASNNARVNFVAPGTTCPAAPNALSNCLVWNPNFLNPATLRAAAAGSSPGSIWLLNNNTPLPFSDQFDLGIRKQFGDIKTTVTLSHVRSHNIFQFVRGNRLPDGSYTSQGLGWIEDNFPPAGQVPGFNGKLDLGQSGGKAWLTALYVQVEKPFTRTSKWGFTTAFTLQRARTNDAAPDYNADEFFNGGAQNAYGNGFVAGVPDWIWNTTANYRAPYGVTLSGTLNLNSGPRFGTVIFGNAPASACCYANFSGVYSPKPLVGYKDLDLRIAKTFKMPFAQSHELTVDFQVYNAFNWLNRSYSAWGAGSGTNPTLVENGLGGNARRFQAGVKYTF
jgi:outer membrane receptor for ferrienterochelin and colicin